MSTKVFVDGQEGTTGLKIFEYLSARSDIEILRIDEAKRKDVDERRRLINASDVTFLCLPDVASRESATLVENTNTTLIDASTAFRTSADWAYGLPELSRAQRERIRTAKRIAVPGCHASAFVLAMRPLVDAGVVAPDFAAHSYSITGYSGGGKKMIADYEAGGAKLASPRPYALGLAHKHLPEMAAHTGLASAPIFTPIVGPFYKGLAVTTYFTPGQLAKRVTPQDVQRVFAEHYAGEAFVRVAPYDAAENLDDGFFDVQANNDTNRVDLFVFGTAERFVTVARLDNLGKGASGAAIQCMNLNIGAAEDTGLAR
ncbi:N-acetyl-gamma-glutamyl-phosphate reductase [Burkholderia thailandensis]|uniref:N-acetyl-gamma-glutamyl-phosphate reductase n=2 Tax=Burkholderia thailandensis TaxID=57975 RepID=A0AAW9CWT7_BURTH|nr:N-acetyl-gamma-glutamyl-phosphate reductase [Burkholderia thailandensis]ABC36856.1 N-acetyl-gamma-glutamyl-phosphate reductase [Burkholderia thailandensis E264]AHI65906.1 N-acetyl-gamma-glutamyl-phosphate reductase [Burkholderia thailandensis H0587]AHI73488.1 N-acetyl-gamma-glutamyl-phosphate reductase [Burkholderia thailandensis 2002721723]AHI79925.1 N-acetyl-gamma-glutamyl-phosphate reductase [Burkholderia thailandensis E444]AIC88777.1 N-acetyl-gamma-glutamyl-phosphate reductase [Burkhold